MTPEEKAKAYDKAYKIAEGIHRFSSNPAEIKRMEEIFPALKESEDEMIIKNIISWLKNIDGQTIPINDYNSALAWLEKQGEQKSTDKIKPKFHEGDWVVYNDNGCICQIKSIREDDYCLWPLDSAVEGYVKIKDIDNKYHLWTIQDAKDGDILVASDGSVFIFKDTIDGVSVFSQANIKAVVPSFAFAFSLISSFAADSFSYSSTIFNSLSLKYSKT